ncbi:hypothetical protein FRC10_006074, partial [Ceratobasidium sp. 414]
MPKETAPVWKERKLVPTDDAWFSGEYIQRNGNRYKCLVCPEVASGRWRTRSGMCKHQTLSITHLRLVREAEQKKIKGQVSAALSADSRDPSESPDELAEDTTLLHYDLPGLDERSSTELSTDMSDALLTPETQSKPLPQDGHADVPDYTDPGPGVGG